jgi:hypothetical protein
VPDPIRWLLFFREKVPDPIRWLLFFREKVPDPLVSATTHFPIQSISRFTRAPDVNPARVVRRSVSGTSVDRKRRPRSEATVRETPSTATDPFGTR